MVIIYLPGGGTAQYCTTDLSDENYTLAEKIVCEPGIVNIVLKEDEKIIGHNYTGMPYYLEMF